MQNDISHFTEKQFEERFQIILEDFYNRFRPSNNPKAYILGGQPGSGKTTLHRIILERDHNTAIINGDLFRNFHPNFDEILSTYGDDSVKYTQAFSNAIVEKLIDKLSSEKYNLVIEGTLRTTSIPIKTCKMLKNKGYSVELSIIAVSKEISWQGNVDRYNEMIRLGQSPRIAPREQHDMVADSLASNLDTIYRENCFDNISLYNREKVCLFDMKKTPKINPSKILDAIVKSKRERIPLEEKIEKLNSQNKNKQPDDKRSFKKDSKDISR